MPTVCHIKAPGVIWPDWRKFLVLIFNSGHPPGAVIGLVERVSGIPGEIGGKVVFCSMRGAQVMEVSA
jgi:hypothetical protein